MDKTIGIKVADGTLFPVLEEGFHGDKRLVLTTVRDNQAEVHIDLYRGDATAGIEGSKYIGSLIIENIEPAPKGDPDIEIVMGASREGNLNVSATDLTTGEEQSLSVSLRGAEEPGEGELELPDFEFQAPSPEEGSIEAPEPSIEAAPMHEALVSRPARGRPRSAATVLLIVLLSLIVLGIVGYVVYRTLLQGAESVTQAPALPTPAATQPPAARTQSASQAAPKAAPSAAASASASTAPATAPAAGAVSATSSTAAASAAASLPGAERGVRYRIRRGDTLWDLSSAYYRDPWLYPRIAAANGIRNPDLIVAGTTIFIPER